jgi:hypothetical protein
MFRRGLFVCWSAWLLSGCPSDPQSGHDCVGEPDFFLSVRSETGKLPWDVRLHVEYGAGDESYTLGSSTKPQIVFCSPVPLDNVPSDAGAGGTASSTGEAGGELALAGEVGETGGVSAGHGGARAGSAHQQSLECSLYTEGPATVQVTALGFETIERELKVDDKECTTEVELELVLKQPPP